MSPNSYLDFDLLIESEGSSYRASVIDSPAGQSSNTFTLPFSEKDLELLVLQVFRLTSRRSVRSIGSPEMRDVRSFGGHLFESLFSGPVSTCLLRSMDEADRTQTGLRVRLHLGDAPALANIPWEFLYDSSSDGFLCLSDQTPLVRYIDLPQRVEPLAATPPLRMLCLISSPAGYPPLDVEHEWAKMNEALGPTMKEGRLTLERIDTPSLEALQRKLRRDTYHVLHFVGHGAFDEQAQDGVLLFEDLAGKGHPVTGESLGVLLHDHESLRLVVLNACEGARTSSTDPFAGTAQSLVRKGIPAVIAMQFEISDVAAITLANEFYSAVADGYPVDAAISEARKAIFTRVNAVEWATPVLYMRSPDGRVFDIEDQAERHATRTRQQGIALVQPSAVAEVEAAPTLKVEPAPVAPPARSPSVPGPEGLWKQRRVVIPVAVAAVIALIVGLVALIGRGGTSQGPRNTTGSKGPSSPHSNLTFIAVPAGNIERADSGAMLRIALVEGVPAAVGSDGSLGAIWAPINGAKWERRTMPLPSGVDSQKLQGLAQRDGELVAVGWQKANGVQAAAVWTSSDGGETWKLIDQGPSGSLANRVANVGDQFVAVGLTGDNAALWSSRDGMTWTQDTTGVFSAGRDQSLALRDVFEGRYHAVAVGEDSLAGAAAWYFVKPNGGWTRAEVKDAHEGQALISVTGGPDKFVAVGYDTVKGDDDAAIWTSSDGTTWDRAPTKRALHQNGDQRMRGVVYIPRVGFVAVGVDGPDAAVWTSGDGLVWTRSRAALSGSGGKREMTGIIATDAQLFVVGRDQGRAAIWTATLSP